VFCNLLNTSKGHRLLPFSENVSAIAERYIIAHSSFYNKELSKTKWKITNLHVTSLFVDTKVGVYNLKSFQHKNDKYVRRFCKSET